MAIQTDISGSPYFDDYDAEKNYHKILFKPKVAVQTRELNQLQSILQAQVERFGDNIFKSGTIIDGCNFSYHNSIPYVKIKDIETNGTRVIVDNYKGYYAKNSANLISQIIEVGSGFETTDNKNTLFVNYLNSGNTLNVYSYSADDILTIYNPSGILEKVNINDGSVGFSNNDDVIVLSAIAITNTTGGSTFSNTFSAGDIITNTISANAEIVEVDTTSDPSSVILRIKPLSSDLVLSTANTTMWTFSSNDSFSSDNGEVGIVSNIIGSGAECTLSTSSVGSINKIIVTEKGTGYSIDPTISILSHTATAGQIDNLDLIAQTYFSRITIMPQSAVPVGLGYGVTIDQGVVYQKGYFIKVPSQFLIVSRYEEPDELVVGFITSEEIIDSNKDSDLLDNVLGNSNETAPGADRLKLTSSLEVLTKSEAERDTEFLAIIEFSGGKPYQQRKQTQYNIINDELSRRTYEESGNYVLDEFLLNTSSETNFTDEANTFIAVIDPGTAYINGYRVTSDYSYNLSIEKGKDLISSGISSSLNYGSYIKIKELGGMFKFNTGDQIELYNGQNQYLRLYAGQDVTNPSSDIIGYARIRSIAHESGIPGTRSATYRLYIFDIQMNSGKSFSDIRSVYYNGINKAVGDIVTVTDPLTSRISCQLYDSKLSAMVFKNGVDATKTITSESYIYRTINESLTANSAGYIVFNTGVSETFPYSSGLLTTAQERELLVTPLANGEASANMSGSFQVFSYNTSMVGSGSSFLSDLSPGDWVKVSNTGSNVIVQIASIANNTYATLTANASANIIANGVVYFPQFVPLSLEQTSRYANVSASSNQMTIYIGSALNTDLNVAVVYNVRTSASQVDKTVHRDKYVRIKLANNEANTSGPWALGVPDVFRLKNVYVANCSEITLSINAVANVANSTDFINYTNHTFSNGDTVLYIGGTYTIPGLSNNTSYFVLSTNSSGFSLSSDGTTPISINSSATNDVSHTFTGSPLYFGANTYSVLDVTNSFYIDHNQTENYYNTSYLYLTPDASITLTNNDILLVKFDAFTHAADAGIKHIESYNIDDTITLENSNTTINTLEIPQLYSTQDVYYDLRDCVDIRPHVILTANLTANSLTSYTINPTEPDANNKFSSTDKKFPAPESNFSANVEYYIGRIDRVIIDKNGEIRSIKGEPGTENIPNEPINSLTINILKIPAYPSYPLSLSEETVKFADTKIANEKYLFKRLKDFRVKTTFTTVNIREEQPKVYRMSDIGSLDRRISDLEYYVALTMAENNIKNKTIPSSIDASLERFKYGFFVDTFNDSIYSDINHPEYNASIIDGDLIPNYNEMNLEFKFNTANSEISTLVRGSKFITSAYEEYTLINQNVATDGPVSSSNTTTNTTISQVLTSFDVINRTTNYSVSGDIYEDWAFTFSNTAYSPVELFMNCTDNDTAVVVFQSQTASYNSSTIVTSSQYATPNLKYTPYVKAGGKAYLVGGRSRWENDTGFRSGGPTLAGSLWIEDSYKMSWNHNPLNGKYYIIRVYKGGHLVTPSNDAPKGSYAFRLWFPVDVESGKGYAQTVSSPNNFQYHGTTILSQTVNPVLMSTMSTQSFASTGQSSSSFYPNLNLKTTSSNIISNILGYEFDVYGLRPNTLHRVYLDKTDLTSTSILRNINGTSNITTWLSSYPSSLGGLLATDGYGKMSVLSFKVLTLGSSIFQQNNLLMNSLSNISQILVCSTDITPTDIANNFESYKRAKSFSFAKVIAKTIKQSSINNGNNIIPYTTVSLIVNN